MSAYQALMLMLAFATFVVALLTFIFTFCYPVCKIKLEKQKSHLW